MKSPKSLHPRGMTLLELTVVILVLLSLISVLFVGTRAWKRGSDRAGCIMNIRNVQQATRAYQSMNQLAEGETINLFLTVLAPDGFAKDPKCPANGDYEHIDHIPYYGELAITCSFAIDEDHLPKQYTDW